MSNLLTRWLSSRSAKSHKKSRKAKDPRPRARLGIEPLEDRCPASTLVSWGYNWHEPSDWYEWINGEYVQATSPPTANDDCIVTLYAADMQAYDHAYAKSLTTDLSGYVTFWDGLSAEDVTIHGGAVSLYGTDNDIDNLDIGLSEENPYEPGSLTPLL